MNRSEISNVTHGELRLLNPIASNKLDELVHLLNLSPGARVIDIGCGRGEALLRVAEIYEIYGTGIDLSQQSIEQARRSPRDRVGTSAISFVESDARTFEYDPRSYDLAMNVGSSHALGGYRDALQRLVGIVRPGGLVLFGEGFWRRAPSEEYLESLGPGATSDELTDYTGLIDCAVENGFVPLYVVESSREDWDRYEWTLIRNGELFAARHPHLEGIDRLVQWVRNARDRYTMPGGRDTLGFGLFLLMRPQPER